MATYVSAIQRLRELPVVFSGRELSVRWGWSSSQTSNYLVAWQRAQHVRALGGHSDVYMNLVVQPLANTEQALRFALPQAVFVGAHVLREAGWTTQIVQRPQVAVPAAGPRWTLRDYELSPRSGNWFSRCHAAIDRHPQAVSRLDAGWALVDMIDRAVSACGRRGAARVADAWLLAPDDLDLEQARSHGATEIALQAFGLAAGLLSESGYGELFDELQARAAG